LNSCVKISNSAVIRANWYPYEIAIRLSTYIDDIYARNKATGFMNLAETSYSRLEKITIVITVAGVFLSVVIAIVASYRVIKAEKVLLEEKINYKKPLRFRFST
jgi:hypothetical protein